MRVLKTILYGYVSYLNIVQHSPGSTNSSLGISRQPWQRNHVNLAGPFLRSMFLIVVNVHSKWPEVLKMNRTTATHNVVILRTSFARNELAEHLISENGPKFLPEDFKNIRNKIDSQDMDLPYYYPCFQSLCFRLVGLKRKQVE